MLDNVCSARAYERALHARNMHVVRVWVCAYLCVLTVCMCQHLSFICRRPSSAAYACCHLKCSFGSRNFCWLVSYDVIISALHFDSRYSSPTRTHINTSPRQCVYLCGCNCVLHMPHVSTLSLMFCLCMFFASLLVMFCHFRNSMA